MSSDNTDQRVIVTERVGDKFRYLCGLCRTEFYIEDAAVERVNPQESHRLALSAFVSHFSEAHYTQFADRNAAQPGLPAGVTADDLELMDMAAYKFGVAGVSDDDAARGGVWLCRQCREKVIATQDAHAALWKMREHYTERGHFLTRGAARFSHMVVNHTGWETEYKVEENVRAADLEYLLNSAAAEGFNVHTLSASYGRPALLVLYRSWKPEPVSLEGRALAEHLGLDFYIVSEAVARGTADTAKAVPESSWYVCYLDTERKGHGKFAPPELVRLWETLAKEVKA
jgi:hypothetical protein